MSIRVSSAEIKNRFQGESLIKFTQKLKVTEKETFMNKDMKRKTIKMYNVNFDEAGKIDSLDIPLNYANINGFVNDRTYPSTNYDFTFSLRDDQPYFIEELEKSFELTNTGNLGTSTGSGKTAMGAYFAAKFGLKTLIIMNRKSIVESWDTTFRNGTTAKVWVIDTSDFIYDKETKQLLRIRKYVEDYDVIICLPGAIEHLSRMKGDVLNEIGFLILDEADMLCSETSIREILRIHPKYILTETATLEKSNGFHVFTEFLCGNSIIESLEEITDYTLHLLRTGFVGKEEFNTKGIDMHVLKDSLSMNEERQDMIVDIVEKDDQNRRFIVMFINAEGIDELQDKFLKRGIECDTFYGSKKKINKCRVIIMTYAKAGVGFDEANFMRENFECYASVLILVHTFTQEKMFKQSLGRIARSLKEGKHPNYIVLIDQNKKCMDHYAKFKNAVLGTVIKCDINTLKLK